MNSPFQISETGMSRILIVTQNGVSSFQATKKLNKYARLYMTLMHVC